MTRPQRIRSAGEHRGRRARQGFGKDANGGKPCPLYPKCIGCPLIGTPYPAQLARKRERVRRVLADYAAFEGVDVEEVTPSPLRLGYRARVKLVVRKHGNTVAAGLYVPGSHRVIDISSCRVHPQPVNQVVGYLKKKIMELEIAPYDERDDSGDLRYLDLRYSSARREVSVTLVTRHGAFKQGVPLARALQRRFSFVTGVIQNVNEQRGNVIWGANFRTLSGGDTLMERFGDLKLVFPAGVFSQANPFTARRLYDYVSEAGALQGTETVLDLYCGVGPISLYLARSARQVWAVDASELAINTAKQNARRNGRGNCRFVAGDIAATLARLRQSLAKVDLIVLNPPRKGVPGEALATIIEFKAPKLVYVSCEPRSLARDLDRLVGAGYKLVRVKPFDMFPQTEEVETVVLLQRDNRRGV